MKKRTFYIVEHISRYYGVCYKAHRRGLMSMLNIFSEFNSVEGTNSFSVQETEKLLRQRQKIEHTRPKIIRVVKIDI